MMHVVGLMSGTSLDGLDAALCRIEGAPPSIQAEVIATHSLSYAPAFRERLLALCEPGRVDELCRMNVLMGERFAEAVQVFTAQGYEVDLIGSHGQTVWHDVADGGRVTSTLQIGSGAVLAERTGITTVSDFRLRDVAAGGQGAPLTSYVDGLLLRHPQRWRAVQNIGGMGNVTLLPPLSEPQATLLAFDTGPGNALIDAAMHQLSGGAQSYDRDGALAAQGAVHEALLRQWLAHPYFEQAPPRTTGRELFGAAFAEAKLAQARTQGLSDADAIATLTAFTARSIAEAYRRFAPVMPPELILGGGGVHNRTLLTMLQDLLPETTVQPHEALGLSSDFKEALVFAVLAYESWHHRPGTLPEQTGARHASILGSLTPGDNYVDLIQRTWL